MNATVPDTPLTGPKAAAKSSASVVKRPVLVVTSGVQSICPVPRTLPSALATTPRISREIMSGWSFRSNTSSSMVRSARPMPLPRSCRISARTTVRWLCGSRIAACAVIRLSARTSDAPCDTSGWNRSSRSRSSSRKATSLSDRRPSAKRQLPAPSSTSSGTSARLTLPPVKRPATSLPIRAARLPMRKCEGA